MRNDLPDLMRLQDLFMGLVLVTVCPIVILATDPTTRSRYTLPGAEFGIVVGAYFVWKSVHRAK